MNRHAANLFPAGVSCACAFIGLLALTYAVYVPGLSGGFLLDDMVNLDALGRLGGIDSWTTLVDYLLGSHTGSGGRPVALATFLLDGVNWPTAPEPFKHTNIMLHLLTMVGLIWLALQLAAALGLDRRRQYAAALLAGAIWGMHPYLVSTVLYIVQRMAILAALFVVFGLGCYVRGRLHLAAGRATAAYIWMTLGIALFTPLAFFSKPNGGLLPVLALVLDATILRQLTIPAKSRTGWRVWHSLFVYVPTATIAGYFALNWDSRILGGYASRPFSLVERLLTEARILIDYIAHLLIPRIQTSGLYHDGYPVSEGLLQPPSTVLAVIGVLGLLAAGIALRRRFPVFSAGVLFFLAAHVLESTVIPLELYFEHRNYLPAMGLAFALAVGIVRLADFNGLPHPRRISATISAALLIILATTTFARAQLWGDPTQQAMIWARETPSSIRAQQQAAITFMRHGQPRKAATHIATGIRHNPDSSLLRVQYLLAGCAYNHFNEAELLAAERSIRNNWFQSYTIDHIEALSRYATDGTCADLRVSHVEHLIEASLGHPGVRGRSSMVEQLHFVNGTMLLRAGREDQAFQSFLQAERAALNFEGAIRMAALLASADAYDHALTLLDRAERDLQRSGGDLRDHLRRAAVDYHAEIARLRRQIRTEADKQLGSS